MFGLMLNPYSIAPARSMVFAVFGGLAAASTATDSLVFGQTTDRSTVLPAATCVVVTPDGNQFAVGSQAGVVGRSFKNDARWSIPSKLDHVNSCAFSPDGSILAVAGGTPAVSGMVELWSWPNRELLGQLKGHDDIVNGVAWVRSGKLLATASVDRMLRIWNVESRRNVETLAGHSGPVLALAVSPDDQWLCSAGVDQTIRVWEVSNWKLKRALNNHLGTIHDLTFQPRTADKPMCLASASEDGTVRIWYPELGRLVRIVRHHVPVYCLAWNQNGTRLYSGAGDGSLRLMAGEYHRIAQTRQLTDGWVVSLAVSNASERVIAGTTKGRVEIFTPQQGEGESAGRSQ